MRAEEKMEKDFEIQGWPVGGSKLVGVTIYFSVWGPDWQDRWESACERPNMLYLSLGIVGAIESFKVREQ